MERKARLREDPKSAFAALGLTGPLLQALVELGYEEPTPIQAAAIPALLAGRDVLGEAATGTGKTAAFALPVLQRLSTDDGAPPSAATGKRARAPVRALVLVPTRELAVQVAEAMHRYGRALAGSILAVFGGQPIHQQLGPLRHGVDVVVATPGRALDHLRRGSLVLDTVEMVVLDEADEMLDLGFADDLEAILDRVPAGRQAALFSATLPRRIAALAERHLRDPVRISIPAEVVAAGGVPRIRQVAYVVQRREKIEALVRVLDVERPTSVIVFCRTRTEVDELAETLAARGHRCEPLHGGRSQEQRTRVMRRFRAGAVNVLVATDVAARGLDIEHVSHVVNFDVPCSVEAYVHRVGRTGRAGRPGVALTFAEPRERRQIRMIEQGLHQRLRIAEVPTLQDVRARQLEGTVASLRDALAGDDLAAYRAVVAPLTSEFDPLDVAGAALKLAHERQGGVAPADGARQAKVERLEPRASGPVVAPPTPVVAPPALVDAFAAPAPPKNRRERRALARAGLPPWSPVTAAAVPNVNVAATVAPRPARRPRGVTRVRVALGSLAGLRPADLVGAIANEAGVSARAIGAIDIGERFATVEVPVGDADAIVRALASTTIRGRRVRVERSE